MSDMGAFLEKNGDTGEHVHGAVLLHIASVLDDDSTPITSDGSPRTHIDIATDYHVTRDCRVGMNERALVNDWLEAVKLVDVSQRITSLNALTGSISTGTLDVFASAD